MKQGKCRAQYLQTQGYRLGWGGHRLLLSQVGGPHATGTVISSRGYAIVPLPPAAVVDGNIEVVADVSDAIEKAVTLCGIKLTHAITSVPASAVITKKIEISKAFVGLDLEEQVKVEADQFIPYPLNEVALDFEVMGEAEKSPGLQEILLVACRKKDVESREDAISGAGLSCEVVDVDTYVVERALPFLETAPAENSITGVIDIGAATLTLNVFRGDRIIYNREQAFGGNDLVNLICQVKGLQLAEVERLLVAGELDQETQESLVEPFKYTVAQQVSPGAAVFSTRAGARAGTDRQAVSGGGGPPAWKGWPRRSNRKPACRQKLPILSNRWGSFPR